MPDYRVIPPPPIGGTIWRGGDAYNSGLGNAAPTDFAAITEGLFTGLDKGSIIDARLQETARENDPDKLAAEQLLRETNNKILQQGLAASELEYGYDTEFGRQDRQQKLRTGDVAIASVVEGTRGSRLKNDITAQLGMAKEQSEINRNNRGPASASPELMELKRLQVMTDILKATKGKPSTKYALDDESIYDQDETEIADAETAEGESNLGPDTLLPPVTQRGQGKEPSKLQQYEDMLIEKGMALNFNSVQKGAAGQAYKFQNQSFRDSVETGRYQGKMSHQEAAEGMLSQFIDVARGEDLDPDSQMQSLLTNLGPITQNYKTLEPEDKQVWKAAISDGIKLVGKDKFEEYIGSLKGQDRTNAEHIYTQALASSGDKSLLLPIQQTIAQSGLSEKYIAEPKQAMDQLQTLITEGPIGVDDPEFKNKLRMSEYVIGASTASKKGTQTFTIEPTRVQNDGNGSDISGQAQSTPVVQFKGADGTTYNGPPPIDEMMSAQLAMVEQAAATMNEQLPQQQKQVKEAQTNISQIQARKEQVDAVGAGPRTPGSTYLTKDKNTGKEMYVNKELTLAIPKSGAGVSRKQLFRQALDDFGGDRLAAKAEVELATKPLEDYEKVLRERSGKARRESRFISKADDFVKTVTLNKMRHLIGRGGYLDRKVAALQEYSQLFSTPESKRIIEITEDGRARLQGEALFTALEPGAMSRVVDSNQEQERLMAAKINENSEYVNLLNYVLREKGELGREQDIVQFEQALISDPENNKIEKIENATEEYLDDPRSKPLTFNDDKYDENGEVRVGKEDLPDIKPNDQYLPIFEWFKKYGNNQAPANTPVARDAAASAQPILTPAPTPSPTPSPSPEADIVTPQTQREADFFVSPAEAQAVSAGSAAPIPTPKPTPTATPSPEPTPAKSFAESKGVKFDSSQTEDRYNKLVAELSSQWPVDPNTATGNPLIGAYMAATGQPPVSARTVIDWAADTLLRGFGENVGKTGQRLLTDLPEDQIKLIETARQEARQRLGETSKTGAAAKFMGEAGITAIESVLLTKGLGVINPAAKGALSGSNWAVRTAATAGPEIGVDALQNVWTSESESQWKEALEGGGFSAIARLVGGPGFRAAAGVAGFLKRTMTDPNAVDVIARELAHNGQYRKELDDMLAQSRAAGENPLGNLPGQTEATFKEAIQNPAAAPILADTQAARAGNLDSSSARATTGLDAAPDREVLQGQFAQKVEATGAAEVAQKTATQQAASQADVAAQTAAQQSDIAAQTAARDTASAQAMKQLDEIVEPNLRATEQQVNKEITALNKLSEDPNALFRAERGGRIYDTTSGPGYLRDRAAILEGQTDPKTGKHIPGAADRLEQSYLNTRKQLDALPINNQKAIDKFNEKYIGNDKPLAQMLMRRNSAAIDQTGSLPPSMSDELAAVLNPVAPTFKSLDELRQIASKHLKGPGREQAQEIIDDIHRIMNKEFKDIGYPRKTYSNYIARESKQRELVGQWRGQAKVYNELAGALDTGAKGLRKKFAGSKYKEMEELFGPKQAAKMSEQLGKFDEAMAVVNKKIEGKPIVLPKDAEIVAEGIKESSKLLGIKSADFFAEKLIKGGPGLINTVRRELAGTGVEQDMADGVMRVLRDGLDKSKGAGSTAQEMFGLTDDAWKNAQDLLPQNSRDLLNQFVTRQGNLNRTSALFDRTAKVTRDPNFDRTVASAARSRGRAVLDFTTGVFLRRLTNKEQRAIVNAIADADGPRIQTLLEEAAKKIDTKTTAQGPQSVYKGVMTADEARQSIGSFAQAVGVTYRQDRIEEKRFSAPRASAGLRDYENSSRILDQQSRRR